MSGANTAVADTAPPPAMDGASILVIARHLGQLRQAEYMTAAEVAELNFGQARVGMLLEQLREPDVPSTLLVAHLSSLAGRDAALCGFLAGLQRALAAAMRVAAAQGETQ